MELIQMRVTEETKGKVEKLKENLDMENKAQVVGTAISVLEELCDTGKIIRQGDEIKIRLNVVTDVNLDYGEKS